MAEVGNAQPAVAEASAKKRRRLKKDVVEFVVQFYFANGTRTATFGQIDEMLLRLYREFVQVNRFRRPGDELDIKSSSIATHMIKDADDELRIGATISLEHYTVIRYGYAELRDALTVELGLTSGSVVVSASSDPAYAVLSNYNPEVEAVEDVKRFYSNAQVVAAPRTLPLRTAAAPPAKQPPSPFAPLRGRRTEGPFAGIVEYAKMAGALGLGLLLGVNIGRSGSAPAAPPELPSGRYVPLNL